MANKATRSDILHNSALEKTDGSHEEITKYKWKIRQRLEFVGTNVSSANDAQWSYVTDDCNFATEKSRGKLVIIDDYVFSNLGDACRHIYDEACGKTYTQFKDLMKKRIRTQREALKKLNPSSELTPIEIGMILKHPLMGLGGDRRSSFFEKNHLIKK